MTSIVSKKPGKCAILLDYVFGPPAADIEKDVAKETAAQAALNEIERHRLRGLTSPIGGAG